MEQPAAVAARKSAASSGLVSSRRAESTESSCVCGRGGEVSCAMK